MQVTLRFWCPVWSVCHSVSYAPRRLPKSRLCRAHSTVCRHPLRRPFRRPFRPRHRRRRQPQQPLQLSVWPETQWVWPDTVSPEIVWVSPEMVWPETMRRTTRKPRQQQPQVSLTNLAPNPPLWPDPPTRRSRYLHPAHPYPPTAVAGRERTRLSPPPDQSSPNPAPVSHDHLFGHTGAAR